MGEIDIDCLPEADFVTTIQFLRIKQPAAPSMRSRTKALDRAICFGHGNGEQIKDIAAKVGMTRRSVENRRQKIMDLFGFKRPVEIVKLLVCLDERGLL
jgi:DNA-binding NarL/FixJ family response regulator